LRSSAASPKHAISSDGHIPTGSASLILVAVDDSVTRQMVVNYLEAHQMRALSAPGREAMMSHFAPRIIQTERGFGYLCALAVEPA
jgi:hypothetical protein